MDFIEKVADRPDAIAFWALLALVLVVLALVYVARGKSNDKTDDNMAEIIRLFGQSMTQISGTLDAVARTQTIALTMLEKMEAEIRDGDKIDLEMMRIILNIKERQDKQDADFQGQLGEHDQKAVTRYETLIGIGRRTEASITLIPQSLQSLATLAGTIKLAINRIESALRKGAAASELGRVLELLERLEQKFEGLQVVSYGKETSATQESPLPASPKHEGGEGQADAQGDQGGDANADQPGAGLDLGGQAVVSDSNKVPGGMEDRGTAGAELYPVGQQADAGSHSGGHAPGAGGISGAAHAYP